MGRKRESLAGSKAVPRLGWTCWRGRSCKDLSLLASRLPLFSPQMTKPRPARHVPRHRVNIMTSPHRSPRALSRILRCSSLISGSSLVSEEALKLEPLIARVRLEVETSSAKGGVSSVVGVAEEFLGMETFAEEEVLNPEVEEGRSTVLVLSAEGAAVVEAMLSLKKPGASVVRLLQPSKVELTWGKRVVEEAGSPEAVEVTKASVRFTSRAGKSKSGAELLTDAGEEEGEVELVLILKRSGKSKSGAELLTNAGEEEGEVELVLILKRSQESSSPRRFLQLGLSGRPSILLMLSEMGP